MKGKQQVKASAAQPQIGHEAVGGKKTLRKDDVTGVLNAAREIVGAIQEQAANGEVDAALLDQLGSALDVTVDQVSDMEAEAESHVASTSSELGESVSTPSGSTRLGSTPSAPAPSAPSSEEESVEKALKKGGDAPMATQPPRPSLFFQNSEDEAEKILPEFIGALHAGSLKKAQRLVEHDQQRFDEMFNLAARTLMREQGILAKNLRRLHYGAPDVDPGDPDALRKAMVASDIPGINLLPLARLMLPVYAGLVRRLPTDTPRGMGSDEATWRAQIGFGAFSFANLMSVPEGAIGDEMTGTFLTFKAPYKDISLNDKVTLKAQAASRGYDDPLQVAIIRTLSAQLQGQERKVLGDNVAALSAPTGVDGTASASGGTLATGTYAVRVTALTYRGWVAGSAGGAGAVGESVAGAETGISVTGPNGSISLVWNPVPGAVAYNIYLDNGTNNRYVATVTAARGATDAYVITAMPGSGNAPPGSDTSANANGYNGLIHWCQLSTIYGNAIPSKLAPTSMSGAPLTTNNSGITQFDAKLASMWTQWQISPSLIICSPQGSSHVTNLLLSLNNAALYRIEVQAERGTIQGGAFVTGYINKFAPFADGTPRYVDILPHPYMPDGTFLFLCETIPYPMSREARGFARDVLIPYTYFPLAQTQINYPFAVTLSETLECFHPSVQTAITDVDVS